MKPKYLKVSEASKVYGIPKRTLDNLCRDGKLPYTLIEGQTAPRYILVDDLDSLMERGRVNG